MIGKLLGAIRHFALAFVYRICPNVNKVLPLITCIQPEFPCGSAFVQTVSYVLMCSICHTFAKRVIHTDSATYIRDTYRELTKEVVRIFYPKYVSCDSCQSDHFPNKCGSRVWNF